MFPRFSGMNFYCQVSPTLLSPIVVLICCVAESLSENEYVVFPFITSLTEGFNVTMVNIEKS